MAETGAKRFYTAVHVRPRTGGGWQVWLDERVLKSPAKRDLVLPTEALAAAMAEEWEAQGERIRPADMPMTRLAFTVTDRMADARDAVVDEVARYAATDLVCYRADEPPDLADLQRRTWDPVLAANRDAFDAEFRVTTGVLPVEQPPATLARVRDAIAALDDGRLAALALATQAAGSVLIALALARGDLGPDDAVAAAQLDETYQAGLWGLDYEAEQRLAGLAADIRDAAERVVERFPRSARQLPQTRITCHAILSENTNAPPQRTRNAILIADSDPAAQGADGVTTAP